MLQLTEQHPTFFRPFMAPCLDAMVAIVQHAAFRRTTRLFAMEFMLSLCESAPDMLRKHLAQIETMLRTAAMFVCHVPDEPDWASKEDDLTNSQSLLDVPDDASAMAAIGDDAFDRIARAIGGRAMVRARCPSHRVVCLPNARLASS